MTRLNSSEKALVNVRVVNEARKEAGRRESEGCDYTELCWVFGENRAGCTIGATGGMVAVGHVMHLPEMEGNYRSVFGPN